MIFPILCSKYVDGEMNPIHRLVTRSDFDSWLRLQIALTVKYFYHFVCFSCNITVDSCLRKYAAQVADKRQQPSLEVHFSTSTILDYASYVRRCWWCYLPQVTKPVVETAPNGNELEGAINTDVEDYKATSDYVVPMSVQHTEAMMEEIDRMV